MNKKRAVYVFFIITVLVGSLTANISAQNRIAAGATAKILQNYIDISSLQKSERGEFFSKLTAADKADVFRFHLAFQLAKRSDLNDTQRSLILESLSAVTPDSYDDKNPQKRIDAQQQMKALEAKISRLFSKQAAFEIFASLGSDTGDLGTLKEYWNLKTVSIHDRKTRYSGAANKKGEMWRIHFAAILAGRGDLSKAQQEFLSDMVVFTAPAMFDLPAGGAEWQEQDKKNAVMINRMNELFSREAVAEIFMTLGLETMDTPAVGSFSPTDCDCCSSCWQCPYLTNTCKTGNCTVKPATCGFMWWYDCNGICTLDSSDRDTK